MKRQPKFGLVLVLLLMLMLVSACGGRERGGDLAPDAPGGDTSVSPMATPVAPERPALEQVRVAPSPDYNANVYGYLETLDPTETTVSLWYAYPDARQFQLQAMVTAFNTSNPWGITVASENFDTPDLLYQQIIAGIPRAHYPAVALAPAYHVPSYAARGALVALSPYMDSEVWGATASLDQLSKAVHPAQAAPQLRADARYSWPWAATTNVLVYNRDWLNELGYTSPPSSWDELETIACAAFRQPFSRVTEDGAAIGLLYATDVDSFIGLTRNKGGTIVSRTVISAAFAGPPAVEVVGTLRNLTQRRCAVHQADVGSAPGSFGAGRVLFALASIEEIPDYRAMQDMAAAFSWDVTALPHSTSHPVQNVSGSSFVLFNVQPESQLAAWLLIQWFSELEQQAWWLTATNEIPAQEQTLRLMAEYLAENPHYAQAVALTTASPQDEPLVAGYPACRAVLSEALVEIDGGANIQTTLEAAEEACTALLQAAGE